ncbi:MAG TPA: alpha/beta hydrolase-fold protein [Fimbriimonadaceae bacterium]|nr:alpha/beta hydrolase-fold protein [Fimbriimonadaceae bacterium]HRJ97366.1 alpha/beta hydrolase-fold protein [Fimbriimonadaceae bacterium]
MRLVLAAVLALASAFASADLRFSVTYPKEALDGPFSGRVVVYLSKRSSNPRNGPNWFNPEPIYSRVVEGASPGEPIVLDDANTVGFPGRLNDLEAGEYYIQAVIDRNLGGRTIGGSPGNLYSAPRKLALDLKEALTVDLVCDQVVAEPEFRDTARVKGVRLESKLLSAFYKRPTFLNAAVVLPEAYDTEPQKKFPIYYDVPGFGGSHRAFSGSTTARGTLRDGEPFVYVMLDPSCPTGHSVFADSDNNGPWGKALTTELIPHIEKAYRIIGEPWARFVGGHSSGGWSSLWLQVTYPEVFGGCWSTAPDPVDFRDFQQIDIYKPGANMFTDEKGQPRPLARTGDRSTIFYKRFSDMERPIRGEQLGSFEAVFSPKDAKGEPAKLWDRDTGAIDPKVAEAWKRYDIGLIVRTRWKELAPRLASKVHVYAGDMDTFYLEGAAKLLKKDLADLGSDAKVELFSGDHGSFMTRSLRERIDKEMADSFRASREAHGGRIPSKRP